MDGDRKITREQLIGIALALGAREIAGWSESEEELAKQATSSGPLRVKYIQDLIEHSYDPLGSLFSELFSAEQRRPLGAVYTPYGIIDSMMQWASKNGSPTRVIDCGAGSARFLVSAGREFPRASLLAIEYDPLAAMLARAHLAAAGFSARSRVLCSDFRCADIEKIEGQTLYIGNPPYVRHHLINPKWKEWLRETAATLKLSSSALAGLHAYFFLATATFAKPNDVGVFITSAEWLDVNYGQIIRQLFLNHLGGSSLHVIEPSALPFPGTATTGVVTAFTVGTKPKSILVSRVASVNELGMLESGHLIHRERLEAAHRWAPLTHAQPDAREDFIELGELCRVHRGQVTGANRVWIADNVFAARLPESVLFPSVTRAKELFASQGILEDDSRLRCVIDIPSELDVLDSEERPLVEDYIIYAKSQGADIGYVATHRKKWWSVGLREAAPILATYMARRPPTFVRNIAEARHINIAHGLYPRDVLSDTTLRSLADFLSRTVSVTQGRTYAGGLTKFEPREMERLMVPRPEILAQGLPFEELNA